MFSGRARVGLARGVVGLVIAAGVCACDEAETQADPSQEQALLEQLERIDDRLRSLEEKLEQRSEPTRTDGAQSLASPIPGADPFSPRRPSPPPGSMQVVLEPGRILLNNEAVTMDALEEKLRAAADRQPTLVLKAAKRVPYGQVVEVTDLARSLGYQHIAMATEIPEPVVTE